MLKYKLDIFYLKLNNVLVLIVINTHLVDIYLNLISPFITFLDQLNGIPTLINWTSKFQF